VTATTPNGAPPVSPYGPDDKIKLQYDIFINKTEKHIMVLQFPNRDRKQPYNMGSGQKPLELRIKPISGLVEVDIPITVQQCYDQHKGILYGQAMKKSRVLRQGGSYGLAGGLGVNGPVRVPRDDVRNPLEETSEEKLLENFDDSNNNGHVLNKITLGGRIAKPENGKPNYFIGVFKGSKSGSRVCDLDMR
jgi:DNA-directed RNA polymerase-3 subunit RPC5